MIIEVFPCGPFETNAYLIGCSKTKVAAVVDAPFDSINIVLRAAERHGLTIKMIWLTHSHWDHIAEVALFKKATEAPVYIHEADAPNLKTPGVDQVPNPFVASIPGVVPDHFFVEGEILHLGHLEMKVIHTPGHTPGGCCFYFQNEHVLISGDTLFRGTIGRLDLATGSKQLMGQSLKKLAQLPSETRVYPGHGESTTIENESWISRVKS